MKAKKMLLPALKAAFPHTIPVLTGYLILGLAYGVLMRVNGFGALYTGLVSLLVFGGSLQYVGISLLTAPFAPVATFIMALLVQARHLFYGISMLDKYKGMGWKKFYLIFAMSDETFSINCSAEPPEGVDRGRFMFFVSLLDQSYWIIASVLGNILGSALPFNTEGLDFVMTSMFVVILMNRFKEEATPATGLIGLGCSLVCLIIFGADNFMLPAMGSILVMLALFRKKIESADMAKGGEAQ